MALRLCHDVVQTLSATVVGTNTAKICDLLKGNFGIDHPSQDEEDDVQVESDSEEEEEEQLPQAGTTSQVTAEKLIVLNCLHLHKAPLLLGK